MKRFRPILSIPVVYRNLFHPLKASTVTISVAESTIDYGDDAVITVSIPSDATGLVECIIGNEYYSKQLISTAGSNAVFTVSGLTTGTKSVIANYLGDSVYKSCNTISSFLVESRTPTISVSTWDVDVDTDVTIIVDSTSNSPVCTGPVYATVNGVRYTELFENGIAEFTIPSLSAGTYSAYVEYDGDTNYDEYTETVNFDVEKIEPFLIISSQDIVFSEVESISILVPDDATGSISISVGTEYSGTVGITDNLVVIIPNLSVGQKTVSVTYNGDAKYMSKTETDTFTVSKYTPNMSCDSNDNHYDTTYGVGVYIVVNIDVNAGNVTLEVEKDDIGVYSDISSIVDGKASFNVGSGVFQSEGEYTYTASFAGNASFNPASISGTITVDKADPIIDI